MRINSQVKHWPLWHYALVVPLSALLVMCSQKDPVPDESVVVGQVYTVVDQPPVPQGGMLALATYLQKNLRYPVAAQRANIQGTVVTSFVVTATGRIADVQATQSLGSGCDEEAVRVIKQMPDWVPGQLNGKPVNVRHSLPIRFTIMQ